MRKPTTLQKQKSLFVTFEGIDGCGKSTQALLTYQLLLSMKYKVKMLREPGSTVVAEKIRDILLNKRLKITDLTELFLYEAARAEITTREIAPALANGTIVLCDRFYDSTTAYQGFGRKLDISMVKKLPQDSRRGRYAGYYVYFRCRPQNRFRPSWKKTRPPGIAIRGFFQQSAPRFSGNRPQGTQTCESHRCYPSDRRSL